MALLLELPSSVPMEARLFGSSIPSLKQPNNRVVPRNNFSGAQLRSWNLCSHRRINGTMLVRLRRIRVEAMSSTLNAKDMNLNEYMITFDKPLGIRFAQTINGTVFVHALKKGGNAEKSKMIMVGDVLKKISTLSGDGMMKVEDFNHTMYEFKVFLLAA